MKKTKIFMEFFYGRFKNNHLDLDSTILFWKKKIIETFLYHISH
jgi:hypothetical protein